MAEPAVGQPVITPPESGSVVQDWRVGLPDELKAEKSLESFKDIGGLAKSYVEAQKMIGGSIRIPKEDAKPEEWDAFYAKLGRPAKVEEYGVRPPEQMPDGVTWNSGLTDWFLKSAHSAGLSKTQATKIIKEWNERESSQAHEMVKDIGGQIAKLKDSWGDQFEGRVELGIRGIERLLPKEDADKFKELMDKTGLGNHPVLLKLAYEVGKMLKEDGYIIGDGAGGALSAQGILDKIASIRADKAHPFNDLKNPGHQKAVDEMKHLYDLAYPPKGRG